MCKSERLYLIVWAWSLNERLSREEKKEGCLRFGREEDSSSSYNGSSGCCCCCGGTSGVGSSSSSNSG